MLGFEAFHVGQCQQLSDGGLDSLHLSDGGLDSLAAIFVVAETVGTWPTQLSCVGQVALLEKETGGFRPIGLWAVAYRLWGRAVRRQLALWEAVNDKDFFAASSGRGAVDCIWKQVVQAEPIVSEDGVAATILWDIRKYYEPLRHTRLALNARKHMFPHGIARATLCAFAFPRRLCLGPMIRRKLEAKCGIIAGCFSATSWVKLDSSDGISALQLRDGPRWSPTYTSMTSCRVV